MTAPTHIAESGLKTGSTSVAVDYPSVAAGLIRLGDILIIAVANKYPTNGPSTPSGWTASSNNQGTGGAGASAADSGNTYATVFWKQATSSDITAQAASSTVTVTITSGNSAGGGMVIYRPAISRFSTFSVECANGGDNVADTSWSVTTGSFSAQTDDVILACSAINTDNPTFNAEAITMAGITFGAAAEFFDQGTATGDDCKLLVTGHAVTAGSATTTATYTATANTGTPAGATVLIRIREVEASQAVAVDQQQVEVLYQATDKVRVDQQQVEVLEQLATPIKQKPVMWLRASDLTGSDGDQITSWVDQSGQSNNATGAGATKPLYRTTSGPNSGKAVEFQAVGYFTLSTFLSAAVEGDIFVVVKSDGNNCGLWAFGSDANTNDESYYPFGGNVYESFGKATNDRSGPLTPGVTITNWHIYNVYSAVNDWQAYQNNGSIGTDASNTVTWTANPRLGMGRKTSADDLPFDGMMAEVLVFDRKLSSAERTAVYNYLADAYISTPAITTPAVLSGTTTFFAPTFTSSVAVTASVLSGTTTFFAPTPQAGQTAFPAVLSGSTTFFGVSITSDSPDATASPPVLSGSTTFFAPTFSSSVAAVPAVLLGTTTFFGPTFVSNVSIAPSVLSGTTTFYTAITVTSVVVSADSNLSGVTAAADVLDDRDQAAFTATITYPEDGDAVVSGGITVYATGTAVDNSDVNIQVDVSEFETFFDAGPSEEILDTDISSEVGVGEVATLTLSGLVADTTYWLRARSGHVDTGEWGDYTTVIAVYAAEAVGEGYLWLYASDVDDSLPHPHLWSAAVDGDNVVMIGAGFGDPQAEFGGTARATYYLGQTSMTVVSWDRPAATGDASTDDRAIEFEGDADPEHDVVVAAIPPDPSIDGVGVYIEIEEP